MVKDKKDVAVPDLKPEEIEVTENGSKRPVESVRFVKPGEASGRASGPRRPRLPRLHRHGPQPAEAREAGGRGAAEARPRPQHPDRRLPHRPAAVDRAAVHERPRARAAGRGEGGEQPDPALAEPDAAARKQVADTLAQLATGKAATPPPSRAPRSSARSSARATGCCGSSSWTRPLYLLMAVAKGQATAPGRKAVLYFAGGLDVPGQIDNVFKATQSEANRAGVSFYAIDVGGLDTWSEGRARGARSTPWRARAASRRRRRAAPRPSTTSRSRERRGQHARELEAAAQGAERQHGRLRRPRHERLPQADGAPGRRPRRLLRDHLRPAVAAWDGAFRSTEVKVNRGGTKVQHGNGYIATPPTRPARCSPTRCRSSRR